MPKSLRKLIDLCYISYRFITNNRKPLFATLLGLIIATTILVTSTVLIDSYNTELINELLYSDERNEYSGEIQIELSPTINTGELEWFNNYNSFPQLVNTSFEQAEYQKYFIKQQWFGEFFIGYWDIFPLKNINFNQALLRSIDFDILTTFEPYLNPGGRLPNNYTEIIVVKMDNNTQLELDETIAAGLSPGNALWAKETAINVSIVGILDFNIVREIFLEYYFLELTPILREAISPTQIFMLTSLDYSLDLMTQIMNGEFKAVSSIYGKVFLDHTLFNINTLTSEKIRLGALLLKLNENFVTVENGNLSIAIFDVYELLDKFDLVTEDVNILQILLYLIDIPIIAIAIYLVNYSYSLIKRQKKETIGIIKTRGGSWQQIVIFLIGESLIAIIITLISGFILGYFTSGIIIRSVNFLDFTGRELPVIISPNLIQILFFFVIIITIILNVSTIIQYTRMSIQDSIIPVETGIPFWKRYYLDIIAILLGLGGYFVIHEIGTILGSTGDFIPLSSVVFLLVGVPMPFFLFFGTILLTARVFPVFINWVSQFYWKKRGKLGAFALRNIVRHKEAASQAVILITLAISYTIISGSLTFSVDETKKMEFYYYTGADLKVNILGKYTNMTLSQAILNVSGVSHVSQTFFAHTPSRTGTQYYVFCFVDPKTYSETAFFDEERFGISSPLSILMERIADNQSIILYKKNLDQQPNLKINDTYGFHFYNETLYYAGVSDYRNYTIIGTFNLWPQYQEYEWIPSDSVFAVGSLGMFYDLIQNEYLGIHDTSLLCVLDPTYDTEEVFNTVKYLSDQTPHTFSARLDFEKYITSAKRRFLLAVLNTALSACIIISVLGSFMFSLFTYLERGKEVGVERALGMTRIQTAKLFTMEGLTILLFGLIIGLIVGLTNTSIFLLVIQMGRTIPPIIVDYPLAFVFNFLALVIAFSVIGTVILAYKSTRKDISRVLKVE